MNDNLVLRDIEIRRRGGSETLDTRTSNQRRELDILKRSISR